MNTEQIPLVSNKRALLDTEVAARPGVTPLNVRASRHKGQEPRFTKMGRAVRYRPEVRVVLAGGMLHLTSRTEPWNSPATPTRVEVDWFADPDYGDTIGSIHWDHVIAVIWRQWPNRTSRSDRE